jgi:D-methionine transport system ATP-binding protein
MIEIKNLSKTFSTADGTFQALKNVNISVSDGDIFGIIGMSGAGKSTLVRCINMLERPSEGSVVIDGVDVGTLGRRELRKLRRSVTMIFQGFNLLMQRTCLKNVCFPLELDGVGKKEAKKRALELLELVGLSDKANAYPSRLSGGQQQRVAIARALATNPKVLLCDEATSALDPKTTRSILSLIKDINEKLGITVIIITHQMSVIEEICSRVAILENGEVVEQGEVNQIFSSPKSEAAKHLVFPGEEENVAELQYGKRVLRVVFNDSESTETPLIAKLAAEKGIAANILYASTKSVGGKAFGCMLLSFHDGETAEGAKRYLSSHDGITVEEVVNNGK